MMRQANDGKYLIGAATNESAREITVSLGFLPKGHYVAKITEDGSGADYQTAREVIRFSSKDVDRKTVLSLRLAAGGGACVIIEKK